MTNKNADGTVETPTVEELQAQLKKAEAKIVDMKKSTAKPKEDEPVTPEPEKAPDIDSLVEAKLAKRDFYSNNADFVWYEEDIEKYTSKGISYEEAATLVKANNPEFWNKEKTKAMNITTWTDWWWKSSYTRAELEGLSQHEYNKVMWLVQEGKIIIN